jgi:hypothetical protein
MLKLIKTLIALAALTTAGWVQADTLLIKRTEQNGAMPRRGATMAQIETQFGAPAKKHGAIGKPPITRWDYPGFSVYFEYKHVIDSVVKQSSQTEMGPKPVAQKH